MGCLCGSVGVFRLVLQGTQPGGSGEVVKMVTLKNLPSLKTNMEPEDGSREKEIPNLETSIFWVLSAMLVLRGGG